MTERQSLRQLAAKYFPESQERYERAVALAEEAYGLALLDQAAIAEPTQEAQNLILQKCSRCLLMTWWPDDESNCVCDDCVARLESDRK